MNAHDLLALGEISAALSNAGDKELSSEVSEDPNCKDDWQGSVLAYLTRLLNHASVSSSEIFTSNSKESLDGNHRVIECVEKLEDATTSHVQGDMVDDIVSAVEAVMASNKKSSLRLNKLLQTPLKRTQSYSIISENDGVGIWDTDNLQEILSILRREMGILDDDNLDEEELKIERIANSHNMHIDEVDISEELRSKRKHDLVTSDESADEYEDEVWEDIVRKTLYDLVALVLASLQAANDKQHMNDTEGIVSSQSLHLKADSPLSTVDETNISMLFMLPQIMYYAPILRHRLVARALCKAFVPNTAMLIKSLAMNCPTAISSIVAGCIDACIDLRGTYDTLSLEVNACKDAIKEISFLSCHESAKVSSILIDQKLMPDVLLSILVRSNIKLAIKLLLNDILQHIHEKNSSGNPPSTVITVDRFCSNRIGKRPYSANPLEVNDMVKKHCNPWVCREFLSDYLFAVRTLVDFMKPFSHIEVFLPITDFYDFLLITHMTLVHHENLKIAPSSTWSMFADKFVQCVAAQSAAENEKKPIFGLIISISFILICLSETTIEEMIVDFIMKIFDLNLPLISTKKDLCQIVGSILNDDVEMFQEILQHYALTSNTSLDKHCQSYFKQFCSTFVNKVGREKLIKLVERNMVVDFFVCDPKSFLCGAASVEMAEPSLRDIFQTSFSDSHICMQLTKASTLTYALDAAVTLTLKSHYPVIYPDGIIRLDQSIWSVANSDSIWTVSHASFLVHLYYWISIFEADKNFPFLPDLLNLSLENAVLCCDERIKDTNLVEIIFFSNLKDKIHTVFPETAHAICSMQIAPSLFKATHMNVIMISKFIKTALDNIEDPTFSHKAAILYFAGKHDKRISNRLLDLKSAQSLLSSGKSLPEYFTYSSLCRDPLVLMKCDLAIWKSEMRLILLSILEKVLLINEQLLNSFDSRGILGSICCNQLLVARDIVIVRCLLTLLSNAIITRTVKHSESVSPIFCVSTLNTIRSIVKNRRGIVASLVRERLNDDCSTFLIEFVHEAMFDADILTAVLVDKGTSAVSRLCTADVSLRMVIRNDYLFDDEKYQKLAFTSLTVMINSFYLVQGPAGMAANVWIEEESGADVCQICRTAMLRMINAIETMRSDKDTLKNECAMALGKLASLCKVEISEGNRKTSILQSIWEATNRASIALGNRY